MTNNNNQRGQIAGFKVERKSRMAPEYSLEAIEAEIKQRYANAATLDEAAQAERVKARNLEKMLKDIRNNQVNETSFIPVKID